MVYLEFAPWKKVGQNALFSKGVTNICSAPVGFLVPSQSSSEDKTPFLQGIQGL